jgi:hypothetical protein
MIAGLEHPNSGLITNSPPTGTGPRYQITMEGGRAPLWSPDSKQLFYVGPTGKLFVVDVYTAPTLSAGKPSMVPLPPTSILIVRGNRNYDITPDGKQFIVVLPAEGSSPETKSTPLQINVATNWFEELKRRVPVH